MEPTQTPVAPTVATTVPRTLLDAASYLRRHGWIQGAYYDTDAPGLNPAACTVGAIAMVCYGSPVQAPALMHEKPGFAEFDAAVFSLDRALKDQFGQDDVYTWNDDRARTTEEVLQVLATVADTVQGHCTLDGGR